MKELGKLALIGSGATTIFFLKHILDNIGTVSSLIDSITVFEKSSLIGCGMPYNPETTDRYNMSNISSEEIPKLQETYFDWLSQRDEHELAEWGIRKDTISKSEVYGRLPLGRNLNFQYRTIVECLCERGLIFYERPNCEIVDVEDDHCAFKVALYTADGESIAFDTVVIATGHAWEKDDRPEQGFYGSPWPIFKILPEPGKFHAFSIGTLGSSLSAFDVITSLAHRHGNFVKNDTGLRYEPFVGTEDFHLSMHSAHGLLPHLQFDQVEPFREIYRHTTREALLALLDDHGFLNIGKYFDEVCRPALIKAFREDQMEAFALALGEASFSFADLIYKLTEIHSYGDAFEGMRSEMIAARDSVLNHKPVHWKEVIDDLMYALNFHAELLTAEDHTFVTAKVMPFLMNVIAAMPLPSGEIILALHAAGKLDLVPGYVEVEEEGESEQTTITVKFEGKTMQKCYGIFVDCSGQKALELPDYPFQGLVKGGSVRKARALFIDGYAGVEKVGRADDEKVFFESSKVYLHTGGIDIDAAYRVIGADGKPSRRIYDLAFPHTSGARPYSYGLQACSATAGIVVASWVNSVSSVSSLKGTLEEVSELYQEL